MFKQKRNIPNPNLIQDGPNEWFDATQPFESQKNGLLEFGKWLADSPYDRVAVCAHGGVFKNWLRVQMGHAQWCKGEVLPDGDVIITSMSAGSQVYLED